MISYINSFSAKVRRIEMELLVLMGAICQSLHTLTRTCLISKIPLMKTSRTLPTSSSNNKCNWLSTMRMTLSMKPLRRSTHPAVPVSPQPLGDLAASKATQAIREPSAHCKTLVLHCLCSRYGCRSNSGSIYHLST